MPVKELDPVFLSPAEAEALREGLERSCALEPHPFLALRRKKNGPSVKRLLSLSSLPTSDDFPG